MWADILLSVLDIAWEQGCVRHRLVIYRVTWWNGIIRNWLHISDFQKIRNVWQFCMSR